MPGQAGYNMNSENAVYFDSEEEAQAAGFVRSKR
ncbi:sunset domain-containing protein [Lactobacillus taiwanensis]